MSRPFRTFSLEQGDPTFVRHGAHTDAGAAAIDLYRIAVDVMKSLPNSDPLLVGVFRRAFTVHSGQLSCNLNRE